MTTYENAPPPDGWVPQAGKHCGQVCTDRACPTCGEWVPLTIPVNIELGCE